MASRWRTSAGPAWPWSELRSRNQLHDRGTKNMNDVWTELNLLDVTQFLHPWIQIKIVFSTFALRAPAANQQARLQSRNPLCVWINHSVPSGLLSFILCIPLIRLLLLNERILCSWLVRTGCRHIQLTYKTSRHQRRVNGVVTLAASDSC